jgi:hypothetical protein
MILKTLTSISFYFHEGDMEFQKAYKNELEYFCNNQSDVDLEQYLEKLIALKPLIKEEKVERITLNHQLFYDFICEFDFSPKIIALLSDFKATLTISSERIGKTNLYTSLDKIQLKPALYIGKHSISALESFICGFLEACNYENSETPSFAGFNDFVGEFYGKYTTAGWKNLILADHFGNEEEALTRFFVLLNEFRKETNAPSSRNIVFRLLHVAMLDFRAEDDHKRQSQIADLLHHVSNQLHTAAFGGISVWYDSILEDIFNRARGNKYLHNWLKSNAPSLAYYEYEIWNKSGKQITFFKSNISDKSSLINPDDKLIEVFYAFNEARALEIKKEHMEKLKLF